MTDAASEKRIEQTDPQTQSSMSDKASLKVFGLTLLGIGVPTLLALGFALNRYTETRSQLWFALLVPPCGGMIGLLLGFLYAAIGREVTKFGPALTAIGSAVSGAGAIELIRPDGTLREFFSELATNVGLPNLAVVVGLIFTASIVAGFLWMYLIKSLVINKELLVAQAEDSEYNKAVSTINQPLAQQAIDPAVKRELPGSIVAAAKQITDTAAPTDLPSLRERGKAQFLQSLFADAIATMQLVLAKVPSDRTALLYLGSSLLNIGGRETESIPVLQRLIVDTGAPAVARKLLAYALLFDTNTKTRRTSLKFSLESTDAFLALYPDDAGSLLNKACALSQLAEFDQELLKDLWPAIKAAVKAGGEPARRQIRGPLSAPGQDFAPFATMAEFKKVIDG